MWPKYEKAVDMEEQGKLDGLVCPVAVRNISD